MDSCIWYTKVFDNEDARFYFAPRARSNNEIGRTSTRRQQQRQCSHVVLSVQGEAHFFRPVSNINIPSQALSSLIPTMSSPTATSSTTSPQVDAAALPVRKRRMEDGSEQQPEAKAARLAEEAAPRTGMIYQYYCST